MKTIRRAIKLKLYSTNKKQRKVLALIHTYRKAVNFYLNNFDNTSKLNKDTLALLQTTKLSERYKSNALKQALEIYKSIKNKPALNGKLIIPKFTGFPVLDSKFVSLEKGNKSFDLILRLSSLSKGNKLTLPTKKTKVLNKWLKKGELIQGCELHPNYIIVWVKFNNEFKTEGEVVGIDLGVNKLITMNDGTMFGKDFKLINDKILKCKKNSKNYKQALRERDNYINKMINLIPWDKIKVLGYENLKNMKKGKSGKLTKFKKFRVKQQHWVYRKVISRILEKCQENRVRPVCVNPQHTSQTCPNCKNVDANNRNGEKFNCLACNYKQDADIVGAINIYHRALDYLRSVESLNSKSNCCINNC